MTTSVFKDQEDFMTACGQTTGEWNKQQFDLYVNLIDEEFEELKEAYQNDDRVEMLDALIDIIVVAVGASQSLGCHPEKAWDEVVRSNNSKIDTSTGKVIKREDGKILKPTSYSPPELAQFVKQQQ